MLGFFVLVIILSVILYSLNKKHQNSKAPPGPTPLPILGNFLDIIRATDSKVPAKTLSKLSETYGEIISLKFGTKPYVIATSREAIETLLTNEDIMGRDRFGIWSDRSFGKNLGIVFSDGEIWEKTRNWTFKALKEFGFGKSSTMEHNVENGVSNIFQRIDETMKKNGEIHIELFFAHTILKIIWSMLIGKDLTIEDEKDIEELSVSGNKFISMSTFGAGIVNAYPFLAKIFPEALGYNAQMEFFLYSSAMAKKILLKTVKKVEGEGFDKPDNLVEAFAKNMETDSDVFNIENFQVISQDLILGGMETTSTFLEWAILFLILYPETQEKIYQEIQDTVGNRLPSFCDKNRMIYTQSFIQEVHRFGKIAQNFGPRKVTKDALYKDYVLKKDTIVLVDTYNHFTNEKVWGADSMAFNPLRFICENGKIDSRMSGNMIQFGIGKRSCPGEVYSSMLSFLFTTSIVQYYRLSIPKGGERPRTEQRVGAGYKPLPFKACFIRRNV